MIFQTTSNNYRVSAECGGTKLFEHSIAMICVRINLLGSLGHGRLFSGWPS
jgi:hypothetical protein